MRDKLKFVLLFKQLLGKKPAKICQIRKIRVPFRDYKHFAPKMLAERFGNSFRCRVKSVESILKGQK